MEVRAKEIQGVSTTAVSVGTTRSTPRVLAALSAFENSVGVLLFSALIGLVLVQVAVRFLLYRWMHTAWADEFARALLVWVSFWGAMIAQRENHHIAVELLYDRLPLRLRWLLRIGADLLIAGFLILLGWVGLPIFLESFVRPTAASGLPVFIFDGALWTATVLMLLHVVLNAFQRWRVDGEQAPSRELELEGRV